ncbi:MAG: hypothetical protein ABW048_01880, partial [Sphingobium sp.]
MKDADTGLAPGALYQDEAEPVVRVADSMAPGGRSRLTELDALRGLGALLVMNFHYSTRFHEMFPAAPHVPFHILGG